MNKKKIFFIFLVVIIIFVLGILMFNLYSSKKNETLLNNDKQVKVLYEVYNDFFNYYNSNIILDESALRNFITHEEFSSENKELLKKVEKNSEDDYKVTYIMSVEYNLSNNMLTVSLSNDNSQKINSFNYLLKPTLFEIKYLSPKVRNISEGY